jgi:tRNA threonylcarbamoyladenosine biosynthesis protein TsaB
LELRQNGALVRNRCTLKLLAIDTSTNICSVCVSDDGHIVAEYVTSSSVTHSQRLAPAIDFLFSHLDWPIDQLDGIAVVHGPGSFTGLRIGLSIVKGLAFALNIPVTALSALEVAAHQIPFSGLISPAMDARRGEIFTCLYENASGTLQRKTEAVSILPETWKEELPDMPIYFCGPGAMLYFNILKKHPESRLVFSDFVLARTLTKLAQINFEKGDVMSGKDLRAAYLRPSDAESKGPKRTRKLERIPR